MASETQHQIAVFKWSRQPSIRSKWPELDLLHHIKNETTDGPKQVAIDRAMGVKRGVPDLCLPVPRGQYHSLYIEMKTETGRASPDQKWWGEQLMNQGYMWEVCHGWKSAVRVLEWYLTLKKPQCEGTQLRLD
jgi:hypothetical protein